MKLFTVVGARPQFIKAAALSSAVSTHNGVDSRIQEVVVHTGQHYDYEMSRVFFDELPLPVPATTLASAQVRMESRRDGCWSCSNR